MAGATAQNHEITSICFLLDESGSMNSIKESTKSSILECIQKFSQDGECFISLYTFSSGYNNPNEVLIERLHYVNSNEHIEFEYCPGGMTALYDAQMCAIQQFDHTINEHKTTIVPDKIIFITITDGEENDSFTYTAENLKRIINEKKTQGWQFMYIGANQDAFHSAGQMGIRAHGSQNYEATDEGIATVMRNVSRAISAYRTNHTHIVDMNSGFVSQ
tara:strand:+ start:48 stop:701 length:654 start_codon:yes stop_codon:yes gene_type:complete